MGDKLEVERQRGIFRSVDVFIEERSEFFGGGLKRLGVLDFKEIRVVYGRFDGYRGV